MSKKKLTIAGWIGWAILALPVTPSLMALAVWLGYGEEVKAVLAYLGIV